MTDCSPYAHAPTDPSDGPCPLGCGRPRCRGTNGSGGRCRKGPLEGTTVCPTHGASAPQVKAAAKRRVQYAHAERVARAFGYPVEVDAFQSLLNELYELTGEIAWLGEIVADLDQKDIVWGKTRDKEGGDDRGTTYESGVNVWVKLWHERRDRRVVVARECIKSGIDERRMELAERYGDGLASVVRTILSALYAALVAALGEDVAARAAVEAMWGASVSEIVTREFRRMAGDPAGLSGAAGAVSGVSGEAS